MIYAYWLFIVQQDNYYPPPSTDIATNGTLSNTEKNIAFIEYFSTQSRKYFSQRTRMILRVYCNVCFKEIYSPLVNLFPADTLSPWLVLFQPSYTSYTGLKWHYPTYANEIPVREHPKLKGSSSYENKMIIFNKL